jgi:hypothetical protein
MPQVKCLTCGCICEILDQKVKYIPNPDDPTDVIPEPSCPKCGSLSYDTVERIEKGLASPPSTNPLELEPVSLCESCQQTNDNCLDCIDDSRYLSPDDALAMDGDE